MDRFDLKLAQHIEHWNKESMGKVYIQLSCFKKKNLFILTLRKDYRHALTTNDEVTPVKTSITISWIVCDHPEQINFCGSCCFDIQN